MKRLLCIGFAFIFSGFCFQVVSQTLKTYSGVFKDGQATYTYKDKSGGGRIYEGWFNYTCQDIKVVGNYKNDKKDGLWVYVTNEGTLKVNYKDGMLDGSYGYETKVTRQSASYSAVTKISLTFNKNRLVGNVTASGSFGLGLGSGTLKGQFDGNGNPTGTWTFDTTPNKGLNICRSVYENGDLLKSSIEDISTGDLNNKDINLASLPREIVLAKEKQFESIIDRGWIPFSSIKEEKEESDQVFEMVEQMPTFPGGDAMLMKYISTNLRYPAEAKAKGIQGRVICQFIVGKEGQIRNIVITRKLDPSCDKEAVRVLSEMPRWIPGKQNGKAVSVRYTVPIVFRIQ